MGRERNHRQKQRPAKPTAQPAATTGTQRSQTHSSQHQLPAPTTQRYATAQTSQRTRARAQTRCQLKDEWNHDQTRTAARTTTTRNRNNRQKTRPARSSAPQHRPTTASARPYKTDKEPKAACADETGLLRLPNSINTRDTTHHSEHLADPTPERHISRHPTTTEHGTTRSDAHGNAQPRKTGTPSAHRTATPPRH